MRKVPFLLLVMLFASCKSRNGSGASELNSAAVIKLLGSFTGNFGDNRMTMLITKVEKGIIEGRTIVAGNNRPFSGTIKEDEGRYAVMAKEPGDEANDGSFQFTIKIDDVNNVEGSWQPFDHTRAKKNYQLTRKTFHYDPGVGEYPEGSQRELLPEDVENMGKPDLELMRNEIFARHGYCFKRREMRDMFENQDWYIPNNTDVRSVLTPVEKKNIELIKRYEKYAEDYGDEFGR